MCVIVLDSGLSALQVFLTCWEMCAAPSQGHPAINFGAWILSE